MLFETNPPHLIEETMFEVACFESNTTLNPFVKLNYTMTKKGKMKNPCEPSLIKKSSLDDLTGTINNTYHQYSFNAKCIDSQVFIDLVNWNLLENFFANLSYAPSGWQAKNGYYYNDKLTTTTTTTTTSPTSLPDSTKNITSSNTGEVTIFSTVSTTIPTTSVTEIDSTRDITSFGNSDVTTLSTISTSLSTTILIEFDTTILSIRSNSPTLLATSIIRDTPTSSSESSTPSITTSIQSSEIVSSTITTTNADHILDTTFETISTTFLGRSTTSYINVKNNKTSKKSSKTSKKSKTSTSTTSVTPLNRLPPNKKSSSRNKYIIFLLFIIGIIALMSFLLYYYQHNRNSDIKSVLDRNDSDESYDSVATQSEMDSSNEYDKETTSTHAISELSIPVKQQEQSKKSRKQNTGRIFSTLDPDAL
ncbi:unnamed protein product [Rotaria sp. Silwood1]|nr:unnamed protein product [Rotaria sp. Silwood1]